MLDRTLLLMRDELVANVPVQDLLAALTGTTVLLVSDARNLRSHSAQCAFVASALLMARSGHRVHIAAPDVPLIWAQPPLAPGGVVSSLIQASQNLPEGLVFSQEPPPCSIDLEVLLGNTHSLGRAQRTVGLCAGPWWSLISTEGTREWPNVAWPIGGLCCGALAAGEAFKLAMKKLSRYARNPSLFERLFELLDDYRVVLAPHETEMIAEFGNFDVISAGAISNSLLFALARVIGANGWGRILDDDVCDISNLNRNALLLKSGLGAHKAIQLSREMPPAIRLRGLITKYGDADVDARPLAPRVLVGVDHIPTRWKIQRANPFWLGIGATSHWSAMASYHVSGLPCAGCLHPTDDGIYGTIPTVAFVSFWSGLLLATYFLRSLMKDQNLDSLQQTYLTPLRPEFTWRTPIARRQNCPAGMHA